MTRIEAKALAERLIAGSEHKLVITAERELASGWVFYIAPQRYVESGDWRDAVPGLGPVYVGRDGQVRRVSTVDPEGIIERLEAEWRKRTGGGVK